jgi:DNA-binding transcriptional MocR family regulator
MAAPAADWPLSGYGARSVAPSPASRMMAAVSAQLRPGIDVNLGVGYVNEATLPLDAIRAAVAAVTGGDPAYPRALNYGGPRGEPHLLTAIRRFLQRRDAGPVAADVLARRALVVGASGATSLLEGLSAVLEPGLVLTTDPTYYIYADVLARRGFEVVAVPEDAHGANPEALHAAASALGERLRALRFVYVMGVGNPSGTLLPNERRRLLVRLATVLSHACRRPVPLVLDRAYDDLVHDPEAERPDSMAAHDADGLVYEIDTLSKTVAPGLRVGWCLGPPGPLTDALAQHVSDTGFSAPPLSQAVAAHVLDHAIDQQVALVRADYRDRAVQVRAALEARLGPNLAEIRGGAAGFYYWCTLRDVATSEGSALWRYCTRTTGDPEIDGSPGEPRARLVYLPGEHCVQPDGARAAVGRRQLRLSYAYESPERLAAAIDILGDGVTHARHAAPAAERTA